MIGFVPGDAGQRRKCGCNAGADADADGEAESEDNRQPAAFRHTLRRPRSAPAVTPSRKAGTVGWLDHADEAASNMRGGCSRGMEHRRRAHEERVGVQRLTTAQAFSTVPTGRAGTSVTEWRVAGEQRRQGRHGQPRRWDSRRVDIEALAGRDCGVAGAAAGAVVDDRVGEGATAVETGVERLFSVGIVSGDEGAVALVELLYVPGPSDVCPDGDVAGVRVAAPADEEDDVDPFVVDERGDLNNVAVEAALGLVDVFAVDEVVGAGVDDPEVHRDGVRAVAGVHVPERVPVEVLRPLLRLPVYRGEHEREVPVLCFALQRYVHCCKPGGLVRGEIKV